MFNMLFKKHDDGIFLEIPLELRGRLFVSPMPYGPYDPFNRVMTCYRRAGISRAVVLVTDQELQKKSKRDLLAAYEGAKIMVTRCPIADLTAPVGDQICQVTLAITQIVTGLAQKERIVIHCNAGVGRTGIVAACAVRVIRNISGDEALTFIQSRMKINLTDEQQRFVRNWQPAVPERGLGLRS